MPIWRILGVQIGNRVGPPPPPQFNKCILLGVAGVGSSVGSGVGIVKGEVVAEILRTDNRELIRADLRGPGV